MEFVFIVLSRTRVLDTSDHYCPRWACGPKLAGNNVQSGQFYLLIN